MKTEKYFNLIDRKEKLDKKLKQFNEKAKDLNFLKTEEAEKEYNKLLTEIEKHQLEVAKLYR